MKITFKDSFIKILIPVASSMTVMLIFAIGDLTIKLFFEIIFLTVGISLAGGLLIYGVSSLYNKYQKHSFDKLRKTLKGRYISDNKIEFDFGKIEVFCERYIDFINQKEFFIFHVKRQYIQKFIRKNFDFIKPSSFNGEECFSVFKTQYITKSILREIKDRLNLIETKYRNIR